MQISNKYNNKNAFVCMCEYDKFMRKPLFNY